MNKKKHIPVMLQEVSESLVFDENSFFIDATFGAGGYTQHFLEKGARVVAFDRDLNAINAGNDLKAQYFDQLTLINDQFSKIESYFQNDRPPITGIILDIGVSSMQIDEAERGFSFQKDGPLDMRMSQKGICAADIVNHAKWEDLTRIFWLLGEEKAARRIARMIEKQRQIKFFETTLELARSIENITPNRHKLNIHPATKVFQALRIYVNSELHELMNILLAAERLLAPNGRLVVVTFHSLEDRIVKRFLQNRSSYTQSSRHFPDQEKLDFTFSLLYKKAKKPLEKEIKLNSRARSAKLRAAVRTVNLPPKNAEKIFSFLSIPCLSE